MSPLCWSVFHKAMTPRTQFNSATGLRWAKILFWSTNLTHCDWWNADLFLGAKELPILNSNRDLPPQTDQEGWDGLFLCNLPYDSLWDYRPSLRPDRTEPAQQSQKRLDCSLFRHRRCLGVFPPLTPAYAKIAYGEEIFGSWSQESTRGREKARKTSRQSFF